MPEISRFLGIIIYMYFNDHNPPHFHAKYENYRATIDINDLGVSAKLKLIWIQLLGQMAWIYLLSFCIK